MQRERGFLDTIGKEFPNIEMISADLYGGATVESARQRAENLLTRFRDQVDGIFCPNESTTFGMLRALTDAGLIGKVRFVGFDASEALVEAMRCAFIAFCASFDSSALQRLLCTMLSRGIQRLSNCVTVSDAMSAEGVSWPPSRTSPRTTSW